MNVIHVTYSELFKIKNMRYEIILLIKTNINNGVCTLNITVIIILLQNM